MSPQQYQRASGKPLGSSGATLDLTLSELDDVAGGYEYKGLYLYTGVSVSIPAVGVSINAGYGWHMGTRDFYGSMGLGVPLLPSGGASASVTLGPVFGADEVPFSKVVTGGSTALTAGGLGVAMRATKNENGVYFGGGIGLGGGLSVSRGHSEQLGGAEEVADTDPSGFEAATLGSSDYASNEYGRPFGAPGSLEAQLGLNDIPQPLKDVSADAVNAGQWTEFDSPDVFNGGLPANTDTSLPLPPVRPEQAPSQEMANRESLAGGDNNLRADDLYDASWSAEQDLPMSDSGVYNE